MFKRFACGVFLLLPIFVLAQTRNISGQVKNNEGASLSNVTVQIKTEKNGTKTDEAGGFSIQASNGDVLIFSYVGYEILEKTITSADETIQVTLQTKSTELDNVVVIGYGTQKKSDLTGAVASVSSKDFREQPVVNVSQILQGRAAGVQVVSNAGAPGGAISVRIRGNNSIVGDNNPLYVVDGFVGADPSAINPNDIETVDVLKDASSTAIYGSRGANGVVVITTKKGRAGKTNIGLLTQFSTAKVLKKLDLLNAADFATTVNEKAAATGTAAVFTQQQIDSFATHGGTNWQDEIFRTAPTQEYQLNISGGNDKVNYYTSGNYLDQQGIIINSGLKRYGLRAAINAKLTDKLTLHVNTSALRNQISNNNITGRNSPVTQAIAWSPTQPVRDAFGKLSIVDPYSSITFNPVAFASDQHNRVNNSLISTIAGLKYEFIKGLSLDVTGGVNYNNIQNLLYSGTSINSGQLANASRSSYENIGLQSTNNLTYARTFNNAHNLTLTGVFEYQSFTSNYFNASGSNLTYPSLGYENLGLSGTYGVGSGQSNYSLLSYLGRATYDYKGLYYLTASIRRDGSSKFSKGNQYSTFPSVGAAWKISEMDFMKNVDFISNLKIRGGYGLTGNQAIDPYRTLDLYTATTTTVIPGTASPAIIFGNPGNPNLKWETTKQWDLGVDLDVLNNRLSFSGDYFNKVTSDLLLNVPLPGYLNGGSVLTNVGKVSNKGVELSLTARSATGAAVQWSSSFNVSFLKNKVLELYSPNNIATGSNIGAGLSTVSEFMLIPGQPMGTYWGLTYLGTWKPKDADLAATYGNKPGDARYLDLNDNKVIDGSDYHAIGHGLPKYSWGWNNTVTWKGFTLNVFVQSVGGYDKLDYTYAAGITANADVRQATIADIKDRYIPSVNETSDIPAFSTTNKNYTVTTRFLENGTFVRFKNISISYQLPKSVLKNIDATLFVRGANLITITKYKGFDPETNSLATSPGSDVNQSIDYGSYPNAKVITGGIKLNF